MEELARRHQIHGVQPVLPVPDVAAAADWFVRVLGFELDFLHGEPVPWHGRVRVGDGSWGAPIYIHLSRTDAPDAPGGHRLCLGAEIAARPPEALPRTVIGCYRPKPGQEAALHALEAQSLFAEFTSLGP